MENNEDNSPEINKANGKKENKVKDFLKKIRSFRKLMKYTMDDRVQVKG